MGNEDSSFLFFVAMHILEIPSFFTPYGGEFCLEQAKALKRQGHEVRILSNVQLAATVGLKDYLTLPYGRRVKAREGITVWQTFQRGVPKLVRWNVDRWVKRVERLFRQYVDYYGYPELLHAHCGKWAGYVAMRLGEKYGIPYVITEHLSLMSLQEEFGPAPSSKWQIPLLRETYRKAALVIPVAREIVKDTACYYGDDYRWEEVSNVVDTDFFGYQSRPQREGRAFTFCCLAAFDPRKGYDVLARAFAMVREKRQDVRLIIAGKGTQSLKAQRLLGMDGVELLGSKPKETVRTLLYMSDALVLPSRGEVQPLVVLEAMSTGIPVVATTCVPQNERLEGACSIVPVDDAEALAKAMVEMMDDYRKYDGVAIATQTRALASPEVIGKRLSELFAQAKG